MSALVVISVALVIVILCLCFACFLIKSHQDRISRLETEVRHSVSDEFHRQYMAQFVQDFGLQKQQEEEE